MKAKTIEGKLSPEARSALAGMGGARIGQVVPANRTVAAELQALGVVEAQGGLTCTGSIVALRLQAAMERAAFGL